VFLRCKRLDEAAGLLGSPAEGRADASEAAAALEDGAGVAQAAGVAELVCCRLAIFWGELDFLRGGNFLGEVVFLEVRPSSLLDSSEEPASVLLGLYLLPSVDDDDVNILRFLAGDFGGGLAAGLKVVAATFGDGNLSTC